MIGLAGGEFCSDQLLDTWVSFLSIDGDRDEFTGIEITFTLDGTKELDSQTTAIKQTAKSVRDIDGPVFDEDLSWWRNYGVPVLGTLPVGDHHMDIDAAVPGDPLVEIDVDFAVIDCS